MRCFPGDAAHPRRPPHRIFTDAHLSIWDAQSPQWWEFEVLSRLRLAQPIATAHRLARNSERSSPCAPCTGGALPSRLKRLGVGGRGAHREVVGAGKSPG